jgi:peptidoglycan/LPS O-acetylase OafA/YrhL
MQTTFGRVATGIGAVSFLAFGAWALVAPSSFFDQLAPWPPYNEHFIHDIGVFQLGIGVALAAGLSRMRGALAALAGASVAAVLHVVSHVVDYDGGGGRPSDPYVLGIFALLLVAAFLVESRSQVTGGDDEGRSHR